MSTTIIPEVRVFNYEAMFLLSQGQAADFGAAIAHIKEGLERSGGTIIAMKKWDERRLAYEINKNKRGVYILCYFSLNARKMVEIERFFNLSEKVMRHLIVRVDHLSEDEMKATDGQKELETEAKLRAERPVRPEGEGTAVGTPASAQGQPPAAAAPAAAPAAPATGA